MKTLYRVTYERVGRHGGRNGSPAPAPFTVWANDADDLAAAILKDARPRLVSRFPEAVVDLEAGTGFILAGVHTAGTFTVAALASEGGGDRG
jgi:hypothetical protein